MFDIIKRKKLFELNNFINDEKIWNKLQIFWIFAYLEKNTDTSITDAQKGFLYEFANNKISTINFEKITQRIDYIYIHYIIMLAIRYDYELCDKTLINMLSLPWNIFNIEHKSNESPVLLFVLENIKDKTLIQPKIQQNIKLYYENLMELSYDAKYTHIIFCMNNGIDDSIKLAKELLLDNCVESSYRKNIAVDYLISSCNEEYVDSLVLNITDEYALKYLATKLKKSNKNLIAKLLEYNADSDDQMLYVSELINLNSEEGIKIYLNYIQQNSKIPEYVEQRDNIYVNGATMSIRNISDISSLSLIEEMLLTAYSPDFKDMEWGLKSSLDDVIRKLSKINSQEIVDMLKRVINFNSHNIPLKTKCNYHIHTIEQYNLISRDESLTFEQAYEVIKDLDKLCEEYIKENKLGE